MTENERLKRHGVNEANTRLADYLMESGNGTITEVAHGCIRIPDQYIFESDNMDYFINWTYPDLSNGNGNSASSTINPLNKDVYILNKKRIQKMSSATNAIVLASSDEVVIEDDTIEAQHFQEEYSNTITLPGLPPHLLELKVNTPVVLLRNLDPSNDLYNVKQLQVQAISNRILTCRILNGPNKNYIVHIPCIYLHFSDNDLPFTFCCHQFLSK